MMPVLRVTDPAFDDLALLTKWFKTKTPSETIAKIAREKMEELGIERDDEPDSIAVAKGGAMEFVETPGLSFTKPLEAIMDGKTVRTSRWSAILVAMVSRVKKVSKLEGDSLVRALNIPAKAAAYDKDGFSFYEELGISFQGQSASDAWKEIARLANKYHVPVTVEFWWRNTSKAQYPGKTGRIKAGH